mgnify:CR=1 FL=1
MNIMFLIEKAGCGGAESFVKVMAQELTARGNRCVLCCSEGGALESFAVKNGIEVFWTGLGRTDLLDSPKRIAAFCRERHIDVLHAQFPREAVIAAKSLKYFSGPVLVYTDHTARVQGQKWRVLNKRYAYRFSAAAALSEAGKGILLGNGFPEEKIRVIPNGVRVPDIPEDTDGLRKEQRKLYGVPEDAFLMTCLSRLSAEKGLVSVPSTARRPRRFPSIRSGRYTTASAAEKAAASSALLWR